MDTRLGVACALVCATVLAGCAAEGPRNDAAETASRFLRAAADGDTAAACALLSPRTREDLVTSDGPCEESLPAGELTGTVAGSDTWSEWAKVDTDAGALFLTEFESGWLVSAAGCQPERDAPYRCLVGG
ncbi:hypothetical protein [Actinophytocola algeriensis]|uniref:Lipoprotein n=1 Tax=Actinophytocola algeriensis TaxID=1768010 RepID=A0A7W7VFM5_9PSEU|nr:hypothetical protein [Actinophytocola algeriensis]MBB4908461.1 hypothetical protein [Actinophytocola algeriensis]MBE1475152.1 hypothetical protein [Actinophytocola algeriensis]